MSDDSIVTYGRPINEILNLVGAYCFSQTPYRIAWAGGEGKDSLHE